MIFRKRNRSVPELNTASTADISFMLLIFFLVTTSMEIDKGMRRQLPPQDPDKQEQMDIDRNKVFSVHLLSDNTLEIEPPASAGTSVAKQSVSLSSTADMKTVRRQLKEFIVSAGPEHIIELSIDREADYDSYFNLQNNIVRSYRELREAHALQRVGKPYSRCNEGEREAILALYPQRIQEK